MTGFEEFDGVIVYVERDWGCVGRILELVHREFGLEKAIVWPGTPGSDYEDTIGVALYTYEIEEVVKKLKEMGCVREIYLCEWHVVVYHGLLVTFPYGCKRLDV